MDKRDTTRDRWFQGTCERAAAGSQEKHDNHFRVCQDNGDFRGSAKLQVQQPQRRRQLRLRQLI